MIIDIGQPYITYTTLLLHPIRHDHFEMQILYQIEHSVHISRFCFDFQIDCLIWLEVDIVYDLERQFDVVVLDASLFIEMYL